MGDAQSAQREEKKDAAAEEESGKVDDAQTEHNTEDQPLKNNEQISEIIGKADSSIAEVNGHCEDEIPAEAILSPDEDVSETEKPLKEETSLEDVDINRKESRNETDANEDVPLEMTEMDAKQNDINESFRRFFSNIGLKLTVKRGSGEITTDVPDETNKEEPNRPEDVEDTAKETTSENAERNTDVKVAQETYDNDSTTCPTLTDVTSEEVLENAEDKTTGTKEEEVTSPVGQNAHQDSTPKEEPHSTSPSSPEEEVVVSPIKRFFTTGIFSGLRKKKKPAENETSDKELEDMGKKEFVETTEETAQDQQQNKEEISLSVEVATVETEHKENEPKGEIHSGAQTTDTSATDPSTIIVTEPEILSSQEKDKVQASPLKRLLSGSSLKKLSKKQRSRKLSDSGEHVSDQLLSSTESAENQKAEGCEQPSAEATGEEDGAWASFKKLMTPKKRVKRTSLSNEETQIPGSVEEAKPNEGGQISDHSTEEGKKRKDSSVSWESVLCGSGRRRSRKTSDSEDETPQIDNDINKQDGGSKHGAESALESSNEGDEILAYSPKQAGSPSEDDGGSTWKSLKRLVTPKRKAKDEDENKENIHSDSEVSQDEFFSIKKLLPGRKKRKSVEKQDQVSSDEADKDAASGDEDSDTPAVVPLSEFDTVETEVHIQTQADIESHIPKEADDELKQDLLDQKAEPVLPCDSLEAKKVEDNDDALENQASATPVTNEEPEDLTESISKQQLSDIPEEATPASVTEEAARDDTIADDLIEITSEAITAPEPLDITLTDETEMISAVSQLSSESSKTSGNTTPVPAEYAIKETDVLLHHVVETMSLSPKAVPVCLDEPRSERIAVSVTNQIQETFVKEEPTILEIHRRLDATVIHTDLNVEELDAINELTATTQTESISEVNDSVSTEIVSEIPTEEFDTAEIAVDELYEVDITHPEESIKELESIDESYHLVECLSDAVVPPCILPERKIVPDEGSVIEAHQTETEPPKMHPEEADSAATEADESNVDVAIEQELLTEKEDQIMHNITVQIQVEDKDQPSVEAEELQELSAVPAAPLDSEESRVHSFENDLISDDIPKAETVTYQLKEETVLLSEVNVETEKKDELETDAAKSGYVQVAEGSEAVQASTLESEQGSVQSAMKEVKSEDSPPAETVTGEAKQTVESLTEVRVESEELPVNSAKAVQEPEVSEAVQAPTLASAEGSVQPLENDVISEDVPEAETPTDEPKEEPVPLTEASLEPVGSSQTKDVQGPEVSEAAQAPTLDSEEVQVQSLEKEEISEDVPDAESPTDEPNKETIPLTEASLEPVDALQTEDVQGPEVSEAAQAPTLDLEESQVQSLEKEETSEDVPEAETPTDEPNKETIPLTEASLEPVDASQTEDVQGPEVSEAAQAPTLDLEESQVQSLEKEETSEDVPEAETPTDEPNKETIPLTEASLETVDATLTEDVQGPEVSEAAQAPTLDLEDSQVQSLEKEEISEDVPEAETPTDEPNKETIPLTEASLESVDASKTGDVEEPVVVETAQAPILDSEEDQVQSLEKEEISEDVPEAETTTDEPNKETIPLTEASLESVDASKTGDVEEPAEVETAQAPTLDSEEDQVQSLEKEVIPEDLPKAESLTEPKGETIPLTEARLEPVDASQTEHVQGPEVTEAAQAPTLDSAEGSVQSIEKEIISEDVPDEEETASLTEPTLEPVDASKTGHVQKPEFLEAAKAPTLDSEEDQVQSLKKEVTPEDLPKVETLTEPKEKPIPLTGASLEPVDASQTEHVQFKPTLDTAEGSVQSLEKEVISEDVADEPKEETAPLTEPSLEPLDAFKTEHAEEPEVSEAGQELDSEEGQVQSLEKKEISEDVPETETPTDEPKVETIPSIKVNLEPVDASKTEHVQEQEVLQAVQAGTVDSVAGGLLSLEKEVISEDIPAAETGTDEPKQECEVGPEEQLPVEAAKSEHAQEPEVVVEVLPCDVKVTVPETKTDEEASMNKHAVTESIEGGCAQDHEEQISLEDVPKPDVDNVIASVTDGPESEIVAQLHHSLEIVEYQKTESILQDFEVEQEVVNELQTLTAVCVPFVNEEASNVQVLEKTVFTEETLAPSADNAAVTYEPKHGVNLSAVQVSVGREKESELPATEMKTAAVENAVMAQVVVCNLRNVSAATEVLIEQTSAVTEPLIDSMTSEQELKEEFETATPLVRDDVAETAGEGRVVVMMYVPSVEFEDNHRIQVQVVDDDIKSAEAAVDTVLEVGVTEVKEVIDVCHETVQKVENLSATSEVEEKLIREENKVTIQEVIQHEKENLSERAPESVAVDVEEVIKHTDAVTEVNKMAESESNEVEDQKVTDDGTATFRERPDKEPITSDVSVTEQKVPEDLIQTLDIPGSLDVSINDQKDDLEETKAEEEKCKAGVAGEEVKSNQTVHERAQIIQSPILTPSNTGLVVPENTGVISSKGNVEPPSSLSIEFKLNIQFGQTNAPHPPPPATERSEPEKKPDVSEVGVQAVEEVEPVTPVTQMEITEVTGKTAKTTEPAANLDSTDRVVITAQPVLLDINIQTMETVEPVEQIKSTERVTTSVQATETIEPLILSQPVPSEPRYQETKAEAPVKQKDDDPDVWMDAEEDIYTQEETEVSLPETKERVEPQTESEQDEKVEHEVEKAPKTEEGVSQQATHKTRTTGDVDSEGEEFAVALDYPETVSVTTMEWD